MWLIRRLFGGPDRRQRAYRRPGWYGAPPRSAYGRRRRRSGGFGWFGPMPYYSTRTRGGARVSVSGCCLPIPLALSAVTIAALRVLRRH